MAYKTKKQNREYQREYRARQKGLSQPTQADIESLKTIKNVIDQWNTAQLIKKEQLGLLPNIWSNQNLGMYRNRYYGLQGNETGIDSISREQIVRLSRELFFQLPGIGVASELKAEYVTGDHWEFQYKGSNKQWGDEAEKFINDLWFNNCCIKGYAYDFQECLKVLSRTLDMDGDVLMVFVRNKNNWPLLQFVGSERISTGANNSVMGKPVTVNYHGKDFSCWDGVVVNDEGTPIGFAVRQDNGTVTTINNISEADVKPVIVPIENAQLIYRPIVFDKMRGLPALYSSVLYGLQVSDLDNFLMDIAKLESMIAYVVKNDAGQAPLQYANLLKELQKTNNKQILGAASSIKAIEPTVNGVTVNKTPNIQYIKADGGEIESFHSDRPSEQIQMYIKSLETKLSSCIGIPHQMIYSPETFSGTGVKAVTDMVRRSVNERQKLIYKYAKTMVAYALSVAMENGYISKNYDEDLNTIIHFSCPPKFTLDINDDNETNLELYKAGLLSGEEFCKNNDLSYNVITQQRKEETIQLLTDMQDIQAKFPDMNGTLILNLLTQRGESSLKIDDNKPQDNDNYKNDENTKV